MPTRHMVSMVAVMLAVCYAAVSQGNGPAYLPAYALFSLMLVSWLHNRANVQNLEVTVHREAQGFAGAVLLVPFKLRNLKPRIKFGLALSSSLGGRATVAKLEEQTVEGMLSVSGLRRGVYAMTNIEVTTMFPLGIFRSRSCHALSCQCYVYPEPKGELEIPMDAGNGQPESGGGKVNGDDFAGVRLYQLGESQRHIDWKAVARGQPMMVKQFEGTAQQEIWLGVEKLRALDGEAQLSQIARWIMHCERAGLRYGVNLRGVKVAPGQGVAHYHRCLRELAAIPGGGQV